MIEENHFVELISDLEETIIHSINMMFLVDGQFDEEIFGLWLEDIIGFHIDMALGY